MNITSPAFNHNQQIPAKYTCDGEDVNPELIFGEVPAGAKSLVLIVDDPDAPAKTWVHWVVFNIKPEVKSVGENTVPQGWLEGVTDFGQEGWGGPCPPAGVHRYFFKLYALDMELDLESGATKAEVETTMAGHILAQAELVGVYERS